MNKLSRKGYYIYKNNLDEINQLKKELTVEPKLPLQFKKNAESFEVYQEFDDYLIIPRYFAESKYNLKMEFKSKKNKADIIFKGELRPLQQDIMKTVYKKIKKTFGGLVSLPCGFGKTVCSLYLASKLKKKTLVIVHKGFLLNQWKERIEYFTNSKVGFIQRDKIEIEGCDIVIGMLQSISKDKYTPELFDNFGLVIFDEAHHASSKHFSKALPIISTKYMLALSATPKRSDGLEKILHWYFGPVLYQIQDTRNISVLVKQYHYQLNHKKFREAKTRTSDVNLPKTITWMTELDKRNKFIVSLIKEIIEEEGRKILILSDRINHLQSLKTILDENDILDNDFYIGGIKQSKLDIAAEKQIILGTYSMASEALDIPDLNTLVMVTSRRNIEQAVGRILRKKSETVQPLIIDIVDKIGCFQGQGYQRKKYYFKKKYDVVKYEVLNNEIINETYEDNIKTESYKKLDYSETDFSDSILV